MGRRRTQVEVAIRAGAVPDWKSPTYCDYELYDDLAREAALVALGQGTLPNLAWLKTAPTSEERVELMDMLLNELGDDEMDSFAEEMARNGNSAALAHVAPGWRRVPDHVFAQYGRLEDRRPA